MPSHFLSKLFVSLCLLCCLPNSVLGAQSQHLLIFGDSLSAAYGMEIEKGWAHLLEQYWQQKEQPHRLTNASISGETTDGGLARLALTLDQVKPDVVMIELGANDGLRGHPLSRIRANLLNMISSVKEVGAQPVIVGISLPPSHGPRYVDRFRAIFVELAEQQQVPFIDFYREDFFSISGYIQDDGLHPTELPQPIIRDMLLAFFAANELFN